MGATTRRDNNMPSGDMDGSLAFLHRYGRRVVVGRGPRHEIIIKGTPTTTHQWPRAAI